MDDKFRFASNEFRKKAFPEEYKRYNYPFDITHCPGYEGYTPKNLEHEVCGWCGSISYYH